jgi:hypothetical protein
MECLKMCNGSVASLVYAATASSTNSVISYLMYDSKNEMWVRRLTGLLVKKGNF